jgi:hypothetical protein
MVRGHALTEREKGTFAARNQKRSLAACKSIFLSARLFDNGWHVVNHLGRHTVPTRENASSKRRLDNGGIHDYTFELISGFQSDSPAALRLPAIRSNIGDGNVKAGHFALHR